MEEIFGITPDKVIIKRINKVNPYKGKLQEAIKNNEFESARVIVRHNFIGNTKLQDFLYVKELILQEKFPFKGNSKNLFV